MNQGRAPSSPLPTRRAVPSAYNYLYGAMRIPGSTFSKSKTFWDSAAAVAPRAKMGTLRTTGGRAARRRSWLLPTAPPARSEAMTGLRRPDDERARQCRDRGRFVQDDRSTARMDLEAAVVFDETDLSELVHELVHARARRPPISAAPWEIFCSTRAGPPPSRTSSRRSVRAAASRLPDTDRDVPPQPLFRASMSL